MDHPLWASNGDSYGLSTYWRQRLQPFLDEVGGFDLGELRVKFDKLGDDLGVTNHGEDSRLIRLNENMVFDKLQQLKTFLHETMHLLRGDIYGSWSNRWRKAADILRFGRSTDNQYLVAKYPELGMLSFDEVSLQGGGSYPVEAGFNRFRDSVIENLDQCGGVCR